ncbi:hypothetical protein ACT7CO_13790 [Bacillus pacificus]
MKRNLHPNQDRIRNKLIYGKEKARAENSFKNECTLCKRSPFLLGFMSCLNHMPSAEHT